MPTTTRFQWERTVRRIAPRGRMQRTTKLLAFILASYANGNGRHIRPGTAALAAMTGKTERTVQRHMTKLRTELGLIERTRRGGGRGHAGRCAEYRLTLPADLRNRVSFVDDAADDGSHADPPDIQVSGQSPDREDIQVAGQSTDPPDTPCPVKTNRREIDPTHSDQLTRHLDVRLPEQDQNTKGTLPSGSVPRAHERAHARVATVPDEPPATRIPDDFHLTSVMAAWCRMEAPDVDARRATEKFIDHYRSSSAPSARKHDWLAAWRQWMRTDQERAVRGRGKPSTDDKIRELLAPVANGEDTNILRFPGIEEL